jgi:hypothetical protein
MREWRYSSVILDLGTREVSGQIHLPCRFTPTEGVLDAEYI